MISLNHDTLHFDITGILGSEINQHIDFYNARVDEAYTTIKNNGESILLSILGILKSQLNKVYKYFYSKRFLGFGALNNAHSYCNSINRASRALVGAPNYGNMRSLLYDIKDYMTRQKYEENIFTLAVNNRLDEMTNQEYHSRAGKLLQGIRAFYL